MYICDLYFLFHYCVDGVFLGLAPFKEEMPKRLWIWEYRDSQIRLAFFL